MKKIIIIMTFLILFIICPNTIFAQRGCCSHHGGVSGCNSYGRQICNDGTLSPTCTCTPPAPTYTYGCTDSNAKNYNENANKDDGSCEYYKYGCTDSNAINYDSTAEKDDGSCNYKIYGCTDIDAKNYNEEANTDDGSCIYEAETSASDKLSTSNDTDSDINPISYIAGLGTIGGLTAYFKNKKK